MSLNKIAYRFLAILLFFIISNSTFAIDHYIVSKSSDENFPLASKGKVASIYVSDTDFKGVLRVVDHLQKDILSVTSQQPTIHYNTIANEDFVIIIGTLGKSPIVDQLVKEGKIDASQLHGKWEKFHTQTIDNPTADIKKALVIAGSDKRGTIYGIYDLSSQIGVSPWHFWSDVPVKKQTELHVVPGIHTLGEPKVKYRGIFINDEAPALTGWVRENFGKFNKDFYEHVFELILRLKGNYLWPAMWSEAFYVDDPQNAELADELGIVMGTSHHEPLTRAHAEWNKSKNGSWDFNTNPEGLKEFWRGGIERMGNKETLVTVGMRGDGDEPMTQGTAIELLEEIVRVQREIISDVLQKPADQTPQIWALYKEVQEYYDKGMTVPDDVTLLLCDDNWGNLRKLPSLDAKPHKGGYGIYYHFDYVGGPRNYKWINTTQIERTWEQMHLAYTHGVDQVWIVNVGDIKPMELPISFFLDYAWNPEKWNANNLQDFYLLWAKDIFDGQFTVDIAHILKLYTKYNARRTPELLDAKTYSLMHYNEAENVVKDYNDLLKQAEEINRQLKPEYKDAYYQLVLHPVLASANLNELYLNVAKNHLYAQQGRAATNHHAEKVQSLFDKDAAITDYYHHTLANGKWNHMMAQTHIGYKIWQEPKENTVPETKTITLSSHPDFGISVEGSENWWPNASEDAQLPTFASFENNTHYFEVFNRSTQPFDFKIKSKSKWLSFSKTKGTIDQQERIEVTIDWSKAPKGEQATSFTVLANNKSVPIIVKTNHVELEGAKGFIESNGYIVIDAVNYQSKTEPEDFEWQIVENLGKTGSSIISLPIEKGRVELDEQSPKLSYNVNFKTKGKVKVHLYFAPTINYTVREGMYFGLSFDGEKPLLVNYDADPNIFNYNGKVPKNWESDVANHIKIITAELQIDSPGNHSLNYYRVDEGLVLQKIIIETEQSQLKDSYLGPSESYLIK